MSRKHRKDRKNGNENVPQEPAAAANPAPAPANGSARPKIGIAIVVGLLVVVLGGGFLLFQLTRGPNPQVVIETSEGNITVELFQRNAPITVDNFLKYVDDKHYDGTIFHRVIPGFMIQGGGFPPGMAKEKPTGPGIKNEAYNGLLNDRGTLAMARTSDPDSATAQFFINLKDNDFLNRSSPKSDGAGYTVFGRVISGMDVVDKIARVETATRTVPEPRSPRGVAEHENVPVQDVIIKSVRRVQTK